MDMTGEDQWWVYVDEMSQQGQAAEGTKPCGYWLSSLIGRNLTWADRLLWSQRPRQVFIVFEGAPASSFSSALFFSPSLLLLHAFTHTHTQKRHKKSERGTSSRPFFSLLCVVLLYLDERHAANSSFNRDVWDRAGHDDEYVRSRSVSHAAKVFLLLLLYFLLLWMLISLHTPDRQIYLSILWRRRRCT